MQSKQLQPKPLAIALLAAIAPTLNFQVGDVGKVPVASDLAGLAGKADRSVAAARTDWDCFETSWSFEQNPLVALA